MTVDVKSGNLILRLWFLMHRDVGLFRVCEDQVYGEKGLTMEQFTVLAALKQIGPPASVIEIARWIGRSSNSITAIVDRMVKAGLVRRTRDRVDRRIVNVSPTSKGDDLFRLGIPAGWQLIHKIMLPLSEADKQALARSLETIRYETLKYLNPGEDIEGMVAKDDKSHTKMMERLYHHVILSTGEGGSEAGKREKTAKTRRRRSARSSGPHPG